MIIKIKSHKRDVFQKILEYMISDKGRVLKDGHTFTITHNLKGRTISEWVNQYKANELLRTRRRKDSVRLTHEILSWHREDAKNITLEKMEAMVQEYIRQRNPNGIYVAVPHFDKDHYHLHICASGVEYKTGKSLRLSKTSLLELKTRIQNYQLEKFPELSKSIGQHGRNAKSILSEKEYQFKLRTGRQSDKEKLAEMLETCFKKASSKETFFNLLKDCNLKIYNRSGETSGILFKGQKFRFNRLGVSIERFDTLEKSGNREKYLSKIREPHFERILINRNR